jgi:hypothetical protein
MVNAVSNLWFPNSRLSWVTYGAGNYASVVKHTIQD